MSSTTVHRTCTRMVKKFAWNIFDYTTAAQAYVNNAVRPLPVVLTGATNLMLITVSKKSNTLTTRRWCCISRLNIVATKCYVLDFDYKLLHITVFACPVHPSKKARKWNIPLVPGYRLTTPPILGWVRNATEEGSSWLQAVSLIGFDASDVLFNDHFKRCICFRTLRSNACDVDVWSYTWIYREHWWIGLAIG